VWSDLAAELHVPKLILPEPIEKRSSQLVTATFPFL